MDAAVLPNARAQIAERYRRLRSNRRFWMQFGAGIAILGLSLIINVAANRYTSSQPGTSVQDLLLDHLPVLNLDDIYLEGFAFLLGFLLLLGLHKPHRLPFMMKTMALFISVRAIFTMLTHLSVPLPSLRYDQMYAPTNFIQNLSGGNDLFFSAHTGMPFLFALVFWNEKRLRYFFLALSVVFGASVLLAHVHYSIDVFSAFFITYAIYHLAVWLFEEDAKAFAVEPV